MPEETTSDDLAAPEKAQRIESTRDALKRDRRKMRKVMGKIRSRSRHFIASDLGNNIAQRRAGGA